MNQGQVTKFPQKKSQGTQPPRDYDEELQQKMLAELLKRVDGGGIFPPVGINYD